jgi:uncharacterized membrane protein YecN with MAPEG domain
MHANTWPALITLLNVGLLGWTGALVARARTRYHVAAPATTGNPDFERVFRVQMNTIEASVMFLPTLWLAATFGTPMVVAVAGMVWVAGRVLYVFGYIQAAAKRGTGFGIASLGFIVLLLDAAVGLARSLAG